MDNTLPFLLDVNASQYSFQLMDADNITLNDSNVNNQIILDNNKSKLVSVKEVNHEQKRYHIQIDGRAYQVQISDAVDQQILKMNLKSKKSNQLKELRAPMPGLVRQVNVNVGDQVDSGDSLFILEAMKMENVLKSPVNGIVSELFVKPGESVEKNQILLSFS
ncbi:MAG: acetyl-CoA carboxylase biotin carboxyl carrier protein subunit [Saprospiraceae bacterium]|nr:acetyl-CoA carboxylase biotin carboxyl carrier protein subunit [Saprospiraceae bacterium]